MIRMTAQLVTVDAASDPTADRSITGLAVPWNVTAQASSGPVKFLPGSLPEDGPSPKLIAHHDPEQVHGIVTERVSTDAGMMFTAKIARTRAADDVVELLKMGAIDAVSVGAEPTDWEMVDGTMVVKAANWLELSLVTIPAFNDARIATVAAQAADEIPDTEPEPILEEEPEVIETTPVVEAAAVTPTQPIYAMAMKHAPLPTAAEYIAAALSGGDQWRAMSAAVRAAAPDVITTDTPGLLPTPIIGPVYDSIVGRRPLIDAIGARPMPASGKIFIRPSVTTHTSIGNQATELSGLTQGTYVVTDNPVTKLTYGGTVNVSLQDIEWSDPAVISLILNDMAKIYALTTDAAACTDFNAMSIGSIPSIDITDPAAWVAGIYHASEEIIVQGGGTLPTHLFLSADMWRALGGLSDSADRPLFPEIGPMNANGSLSPSRYAGSAFGLTVVVDANFAAETIIVGDPSGFEIFEQQRGAISVETPSNLGRTLSWYGYFATLAIWPEKFYSIPVTP
jgi:HK97 family phage prohead protease